MHDKFYISYRSLLFSYSHILISQLTPGFLYASNPAALILASSKLN